MTKPTILITGATGKTGSAAALEVLARGYPVRAMVHGQDERSARLQAAGAQVVAGSLEDIDDLTAAMSGVRRAAGMVSVCHQLRAAPSALRTRRDEARPRAAKHVSRSGSGSVVLASGSDADYRAWSATRRQPRA
jgi:uncharacterized protein YbjT (DUF2867 family)